MVVFDINVILDKWAKEYLRNEDGSAVKHYEIDTSKVRIVTTSTSPDDKKNKDARQSEDDKPSSMVVKSKYVNRTPDQQEHTFIVERKTETTVTTKLTKGFSFNGKVGIKIEVPGNEERMNGGFGNDVTIETEDENILKETIGWSVNSKVIAPGNTTTVAILKIHEKISKFDFTATVTLKGRVIAREVGGRGPVTVGDLAHILQYALNKDTGGVVDMTTRKVTWNVDGSLKFRYGVSQDVEVHYETNPPEERTVKVAAGFFHTFATK